MNYSEEEKEEYEELKNLLYTGQLSQYGKRKLIEIIETQKAEIEKKNKAMDLMAEQLTTPIHDKKWVIEYYTKLAEENKK